MYPSTSVEAPQAGARPVRCSAPAGVMQRRSKISNQTRNSVTTALICGVLVTNCTTGLASTAFSLADLHPSTGWLQHFLTAPVLPCLLACVPHLVTLMIPCT